MSACLILFFYHTFNVFLLTIFWYSKSSKNFTYNQIFFEIEDENHYRQKDENGRIYRTASLIAPGKGYVYEFNGVTKNWRCALEKMLEYQKQGRIKFTKTGTAEYIRYLDESKGRALDNFWADIPPVNSQAKERIGYPTQKPEKLLERIIKASSNEGDTVLDCFLGGGTTVAVADKLNRNWIGIDQSVQAIKVSEFRLNRQRNLFSQPFEVRLHKYDYDTLRYKDAFEFESWIVEQFGGQSNIKQRGDLGLDGKDKNGKPIQVKRSDGIGRNVIDNFISASKRYDKNLFEKAIESGEIIGTIIAFSFGKGAIQEAARLKNEDKILIDLIKVEEIIAIAKKPNVKLEIKLLEKKEKTESYSFIIKATADDGSQIEFYSFEINKITEAPTVKGGGQGFCMS